MVRAAVFLSLVLVAAGAAGAGISGVASVTDGDTLRIGSERIRFHGIAGGSVSSADGCAFRERLDASAAAPGVVGQGAALWLDLPVFGLLLIEHDGSERRQQG